MKAIDKIVDMVIEGLENGTVPWRKPWKECIPMNTFSRRPYRGFNRFMLNFAKERHRYSYPLFSTFKQISDAGGNVKRGEKSFPVIYWKVTYLKTPNDESGIVEESEKRFTPFFFNVFNLDQTEGFDRDRFISEFTSQNSNNPLETCETVISGMPHPPQMTYNRSSAFYMPKSDLVNVPQIELFDSSQEYYAAVFHELAHSTGHSSRLNRFEDHVPVFGSQTYSYEELVAEMTATILCSHCGIDQTVENSVAYLTGWAKFLKTERKSTLFGAATKAQLAADYILGASVETDLPEYMEEDQLATVE